MKTEGIFRVTGDDKKINELKMHLCAGNYNYLTKVDDAHTVTNYWKRLLREMKDPLIPFAFYEQFGSILTPQDLEYDLNSGGQNQKRLSLTKF